MMTKLEEYLQTLPVEKLKEIETKLASDQEIIRMQEQIDTLNATYHPQRGAITSRYRGHQSFRRGELLLNTNFELTQLVEAMRLRVEASTLQERLEIHHQLENVLNKNLTAVAQLASQKGMTPEVYSQFLLMQLEIDKTLAIEKGKWDIEYEGRIKGALLSKLVDAREELKRLKQEKAEVYEVEATKEYIDSLEGMVQTFWGRTFSKT